MPDAIASSNVDHFMHHSSKSRKIGKGSKHKSGSTHKTTSTQYEPETGHTSYQLQGRSDETKSRLIGKPKTKRKSARGYYSENEQTGDKYAHVTKGKKGKRSKTYYGDKAEKKWGKYVKKYEKRYGDANITSLDELKKKDENKYKEIKNKKT